MFGLVGHYVEEICDFSYDYVISCLQVKFAITYAFLLYWVVAHFYHSLYDACFFNYWCFVAKTVVCVACEEDGSPWGLDTEVRFGVNFHFLSSHLFAVVRKCSRTRIRNGVNSEDHNVHTCVCACV